MRALTLIIHYPVLCLLLSRTGVAQLLMTLPELKAARDHHFNHHGQWFPGRQQRSCGVRRMIAQLCTIPNAKHRAVRTMCNMSSAPSSAAVHNAATSQNKTTGSVAGALRRGFIRFGIIRSATVRGGRGDSCRRRLKRLRVVSSKRDVFVLQCCQFGRRLKNRCGVRRASQSHRHQALAAEGRASAPEAAQRRRDL